MDVLAAVKSSFFDRKAVTMRVPKMKRKALSKAGAFVRRRAKTSMRKGKGVSAPGMPPKAHVGLLRQLLFFAYEFNLETVVVGPAPIRRFTGVPRLLETGGIVRRTTAAGMPYIATYEPRPYMRPALMAEVAAGTIGKAFIGTFT